MLNDLGQNPKVAVITLISGLAKLVNVFHPFMTPYFRNGTLWGSPQPINFISSLAYQLPSSLSLLPCFLSGPINFLLPSPYQLPSFPRPINFLPFLGISTSFLPSAHQLPSSLSLSTFFLPGLSTYYFPQPINFLPSLGLLTSTLTCLINSLLEFFHGL